MSRHSIQRTKERYNLDLSYADEVNIISLLKQGKGIPLPQDSKEPNRKFAYVTYKNIPLKVLYERSQNKGVKSIITTYPLDVDEFNEVNQQVYDSYVDMSIKFLKSNGYIVYKRKSQV